MPTTDMHRLRPRQSLFRQGMLAIVAFLAPVFTVLYFFTIPEGTWIAVLITQFFATVLVLFAVYRYHRTGIWVQPGGIIEREFLGKTISMTSEQIGSIVLVRTYVGAGTETVPQLFVCDLQGNQVVRMRGQFWTMEAMTEVSEVLDVPVIDVTESMTPRELLEQYPGLLYWFERRPVPAAAAFSAAVLVGGIIVYVGLKLLGISPR